MSVPLDVSSPTSNATIVNAHDDDDAPVNVSGVISIAVFYLAVLAVGIWAGWKQRREAKEQGRTSNNQVHGEDENAGTSHNPRDKM
jgi:hypothetical protein